MKPLESILGREIQINHQKYSTAVNQTSLQIPLEIYHRDNFPRFHLVLIYGAHGSDIAASYRSLFVERIVDACEIVEHGCYTSNLGSRCP